MVLDISSRRSDRTTCTHSSLRPIHLPTTTRRYNSAMKTRANGSSRAPHVHRGQQSQTPFYGSTASLDVARRSSVRRLLKTCRNPALPPKHCYTSTSTSTILQKSPWRVWSALTSTSYTARRRACRTSLTRCTRVVTVGSRSHAPTYYVQHSSA